MIVVTGGAGFIGSNLIKGLNRRGYSDILVVDNLRRGGKFANLRDLDIADYCDKDDFLSRLAAGAFGAIEAVFHQGACSTTTEWDGRYMLQNNYEYSKRLLHECLERRVPLVYASSASVYGHERTSREARQYETPLNVYGYSKFLFDEYLRRLGTPLASPVIGLRYFNVYGPREAHKGTMASVVFHLRNQLLATGQVRLFGDYDGFTAGEQRRDFIHVDDVVAVNLWCLERPASGIYNVGTGQSRSFNDLARAVLDYYGRGELVYAPFPDHLKGAYQSFTEADISALRTAGYHAPFISLEQGVRAYLDDLEAAPPLFHVEH